MTLSELKKLLTSYNIPERWYSLNEGLKLDAFILHNNYSKWEYFYLDEKGEKHDFILFLNESDALDYLWKKLKRQSEIFKRSSNENS